MENWSGRKSRRKFKNVLKWMKMKTQYAQIYEAQWKDSPVMKVQSPKFLHQKTRQISYEYFTVVTEYNFYLSEKCSLYTLGKKVRKSVVLENRRMEEIIKFGAEINSPTSSPYPANFISSLSLSTESSLCWPNTSSCGAHPGGCWHSSVSYH